MRGERVDEKLPRQALHAGGMHTAKDILYRAPERRLRLRRARSVIRRNVRDHFQPLGNRIERAVRLLEQLGVPVVVEIGPQLGKAFGATLRHKHRISRRRFRFRVLAADTIEDDYRVVLSKGIGNVVGGNGLSHN